MCALPDERAVIQHKDLIGILDGGRALRHQKYGDVRIVGADGLAQARVRGIVQRGGAVVQNENFGIAHERTGNGQSLALAAGKVLAALRDLDRPDIRTIYARCPEGGGVAYAVGNRLKKAAAFRVVDAEHEA